MVDYRGCKMLGSEEEFESQPQSGMTKAELRRSNKPIMEKRRRARINQSLDELKALILEAMKKDPTRHSKLEKADILEMAVKHIQSVHRQQLSTAIATDPAVLTKFRSGFSECATEVSRYVSQLENVDPVVKQRLVSHLNNCVNNLQQMAPFYSHYVPYMPERLYPEVKVGFQNDFQNGDENNNGSARIQIPNGVQLIPSRLPTGELALLVPQSAGISANFPFFPPAADSSARIGQSSAFTTVQRSHSPLLSPSTSTSSYGDESHHSEQYPQTSSPNHSQSQRRFKLPQRSPASSKSFSSSPETQRSQISSTSDRKSPATFAEPKASESNGAVRKDPTENAESGNQAGNLNAPGLRQPLSVITDKTYNRAPNALPSSAKRDGLKKRHSDGLLVVISDKRPRYQEPTSSSSAVNNAGALKSTDEQSAAIENPESPNCQAPRSSHVNCDQFSVNLAGPSGGNGDMWRPW